MPAIDISGCCIPAAVSYTHLIFFHENDNVSKVRNTFTLSDKNNIIWKLFDGKTFSNETTGLKIDA